MQDRKLRQGIPGDAPHLDNRQRVWGGKHTFKQGIPLNPLSLDNRERELRGEIGGKQGEIWEEPFMGRLHPALSKYCGRILTYIYAFTCIIFSACMAISPMQ